MHYLIKGAEVWTLDESGTNLELNSFYYSGQSDQSMQAFKGASESMRFGIDEGLPGQTWAERRPLIWTDLSVPHFKRRELAEIAGIACGLSIPVYAGEFLLGVVVLFCARDEDIFGAVEVWQNRDSYDNELRLKDGYYGSLERFEFISRALTILRGRGLPGSAWSQRSPRIMTNISEAEGFIRARNAAESGINTGLAIPFFYTGRDVQIVALLSTDSTPAANRFEVWKPDEGHSYLLFDQGYCSAGSDLHAEYRGKAFDRGESTLGQVWLNGRPFVEKSELNDQNGTVYLPLIDGGLLSAVVKFVF